MVHLAPYVNALLAWLEAEDDTGLPAALERQNALYDAALAVERPVRYTDGTEDILGSPWVEVSAPTWHLHDLSIGAARADLDITLAVRGYLEDPRHGTLDKRLKIFGAALVDSIIQPGAFDAAGGAAVREMRGTYPINVETGEKTYYRGSAVIVVTIEVDEARTAF